jgi:hypothetical protein
LVAQKKVCEKAKSLFTRLEGGDNYQEHRRGKMKYLKNRGCILDVDCAEVEADKERERKARGSVLDTQHTAASNVKLTKKDVA